MQPFQNIKVLDFTQVISGPLATQMLSMGGAEVIKIEPPEGDAIRIMMDTPDTIGTGLSPIFVALNAGKRIEQLDLKSPNGKARIAELAAACDVCVENFRPGVAARLGLDYESVRKIRPDVIYCSVSGYGQTGQHRKRAAYDSSVQASSGMMSTTGNSESGPMRTLFAPVDTAAGLIAGFAITSALLRRAQTGEGQFVDVAMFDAALWLQLPTISKVLAGDKVPGLTGNKSSNDVLTAGVFETTDGYILVAGMSPAQGRAVLNAVKLPEALWDTYISARAGDPALAEDCSAQIRARFLMHDSAHWETLLCEAGVPIERVRDLSEAIQLSRETGRSVLRDLPAVNGPVHRSLGPIYQANVDGPRASDDIPSPGPSFHS